MAKLSINSAWNEASAFVKQESGTLFLIAFGLMALPSIILQFLLPPMQLTVAAPGAPPEPLPARNLAMLAAMIPVLLLNIWGVMTITALVLRLETVVGSAFRRAARRILPLAGASLLLAIAALMILVLIAAILFAGATPDPAKIGGLAIVGLFVLAAPGAKLLVMSPVAVAERGGPLRVIARSWSLTAGHFWRLYLFLLLIFVLLLVIMIAVGSVGGLVIMLIAGRPDPGSLSFLILSLVSGVVQAIFTTYLTALVARIYAQLAGDSSVAERFQ